MSNTLTDHHQTKYGVTLCTKVNYSKLIVAVLTISIVISVTNAKQKPLFNSFIGVAAIAIKKRSDVLETTAFLNYWGHDGGQVKAS